MHQLPPFPSQQQPIPACFVPPRSASLPNNKSTTTSVSHRSNDVEYPKLGLKVLIVGSCFLSGAIAMFRQADCTRATSMDDADLVCYLGGEDVDPQLYGETALRGTYFSTERDAAEMDVFTEALSKGKPQFGICRGMQFLHVMNGGKLWQDVTGHAGSPHEIFELATGRSTIASSMHHQMCIENETDKSVVPLAYGKHTYRTYRGHGRELSSGRHNDLEAAYYPDINSLGVQGHPEVGGLPEYTAYCLDLVGEYLMGASRIIGHNYRINPEAIPAKIGGTA